MADLEGAADQALTKLKDLEAEMDKAQTAMDDADAEVKRLAGQLETDWSSFEDAAESLVDRARSIKQALDVAGQQTQHSLAELQQHFATGLHDAAEEAQHAGEEVAALDQQVDAATPDVATKGDAFGTQSKAIAEHASQMAGELQTTFAQVEHFLEQEVLASVRQMKESVHDMAQKVRHEIFETAVHDLQEGHQILDTHLDKVDEALSGAMGDTALHVPMVIDYATGEFKTKVHDQQLEHLHAVATSLKAVMEQLEATVEAQDQMAKDLAQPLAQSCGQVDQTATTAVQALSAVRELLARYTMVS
jgi:chromosome segregation ATPase